MEDWVISFTFTADYYIITVPLPFTFANFSAGFLASFITLLAIVFFTVSLSLELSNLIEMALKLYGAAMSTCTSRVLTCLHEKEADFEFISVNLFAGEHKEPSFLAKNPFGQIPVLEDGDLTLFESRAISAYVAEKFKESGYDLIRYQNVKEGAQVKVWMEVESQQYHPAISPIVFQFFVAPLQGKSPEQAIIDENLEKLGKVLDIYEDTLSRTKYLAGDFYSLADLFHLSYTYYFMKTPWANQINDRPHVKAWWEDIASRPAFLKVASAMNFGEKQN
ncbi:LOW QUALITY PROTEIN: glutathione S-transferase F13-like [Herrania umbratica]|uniref:glutathione transferase n=1 Tax=Herrania umbratica TaxID=108875 RepID=A0A6J1A1G1_9ROSI|nr:LOW QUALITY PROTEIN: glutathione S-transferase F13-like [Herrania umbratica]